MGFRVLQLNGIGPDFHPYRIPLSPCRPVAGQLVCQTTLMTPKALKNAFARSENITELLRGKLNSEQNTEEIIETAYDLQAGSYVRALEFPEMLKHKQVYGEAIASEISRLTSAGSILEPGVGEGTTMSFVVRSFDNKPRHVHGFDISWSRIACCRDWLVSQGFPDVHLSVASVLRSPYLDDSFDVVYTSHTIEPNGGSEAAILSELYRISSRYLILLEPGYELADEMARERMKRLGYCIGLVDHATALGMKVIEHRLFAHSANPLNPTAITIIAKNPNAPSVTPKLACPRYLTPLLDYSESLYSADSLRAYPKIKGIPCLRTEDGIIASTYLETKANRLVESTR